ncbi:WD repeat-containing protein [[Candida] jaroonii]|uniref:WD repeat-containing protein n=1 Tax=[Candida] jaroonii TaxID=467808 RepID=A0ACA9YF29_9ASCO|nr:WD repeat-containing protein [[Candida] jaroonii]
MEWRKNSTFQNPNYIQSPFSSPTNNRNQYYNANYSPISVIRNQPLLPPSFQDQAQINNDSQQNNEDFENQRFSYYMSSFPLYCCDWTTINEYDTECIALSSYKEGLNNKLHILHGLKYGKEATFEEDEDMINGSFENDNIEGFDFHKVSEIDIDYPVTNLQWDPMMSKYGLNERLATSSEVLRLYKVDHDSYDNNGDYQLVQTHYLTNNNSKAQKEMMTNPPVTSFDWNKVDNSIIITSSVDTTCTVWDLNRSISIDNQGHKVDSAAVKTQLIAHDSEVFDVKFLNDSTNLFASVGNDGSMRIFDLRSLEHSTIIYEPSNDVKIKSSNSSSYNSKALIKLDTSNIDQHYLATIGVNSDQIIIIDTRMPGVPVSILDGSFDGLTNTAINSIKWHPSSNFLLSGGDDCQSLVWDCNNLFQNKNDSSMIINSPVMAYQDNLEINNVCWRGGQGDWMGVVSGKGFQAVSI